MLLAQTISKEYVTPGGTLPILAGVNLSGGAGEAGSIVGASGSGKSTLLYVLGALEAPTAGTVTLDGVNPYALDDRKLSEFRNRSVGFVFQDDCLLPQCTVLENVLIPAISRRPDPADKERARFLLERVGLKHRLDHRPGELSGGEKQRCSVARALVRRPKLLLCDEPTGNLDPATAAEVAELLFDVHRDEKTALIVVTHSMELAGRFPVRYEMNARTLRRL